MASCAGAVSASTPPVPRLAYIEAGGGLAVWSQGEVESIVEEPLHAGELAWSPAGNRIAHVGSGRPAAHTDPIAVSIFGLDGDVSVIQVPREEEL